MRAVSCITSRGSPRKFYKNFLLPVLQISLHFYFFLWSIDVGNEEEEEKQEKKITLSYRNRDHEHTSGRKRELWIVLGLHLFLRIRTLKAFEAGMMRNSFFLNFFYVFFFVFYLVFCLFFFVFSKELDHLQTFFPLPLINFSTKILWRSIKTKDCLTYRYCP